MHHQRLPFDQDEHPCFSLQGLDLYFERHDGSAVTCDDFLAAMADANGEDLSLMSKCACSFVPASAVANRAQFQHTCHVS